MKNLKALWQVQPLDFKNVVAGFALFVFLGWAYGNFISQTRHLDSQIFDFQKTYSWREVPQGIYRVDARENMDSTLLSRENFKDFDFEFTGFNLRNCGIIHGYIDEKNFSYIYFNESSQSLLWALTRDGRQVLLKAVKTYFRPQINGRLTVHDQKGEFFIDGQPVMGLGLSAGAGKIGFILPHADSPKTIFKPLLLTGHTDRGQARSMKATGPVFQQKLRYFLAVVILSLALLLNGGYWARVYALKGGNFSDGAEKEEKRIPRFIVATIHLVLAAVIFYPFVFKGEILVSSADNYGEIFPLFFFSKHNFQNILQGGGLGLWNPYTHNGVPFYSNHWNMIFDPLNWPIFFLPDSQVLPALTFRTFVQVFLIGVLAYEFFRRELTSPLWALYCSVVYQLCSLLIFTLTVFPSISLYFAMTLYLYLLWSIEERRPVWNYLFLTGAVILILTSANVAFIFYAGVSLVIVTLYQFWTIGGGKKARQMFAAMVLGAVLTGVLISAVRIFPCIMGVMDSNRIVDNYYTLHDRMPMVVRMFLPEIVGWLGSDTLNALTSKNLNLIYEQSDLPSNSQNTFLAYFGVVAGLLLLLNTVIKTEGRHAFWKTYAFVAILAALLFQPVWGILSILFFPLNHYSYHAIILPVGICMLLGYTGQLLESRRLEWGGLIRRFLGAIFLIQALILVIVTYLFPELTVVTRLIFLAIVVWYGIFVWMDRQGDRRKQRMVILSAVGLAVVTGLAVFVTGSAFLIKPLAAKELVGQFLFIPNLLVLLGILFFALAVVYWEKKVQLSAGLKACLAAFPLITAIVLSLPWFSRFLELANPKRNYLVDFLFGEAKFLLVTLIAVTVFYLYKKNRLPRSFFLKLVIAITVFDLLAFNLRFDNVVAPSPINTVFHPMHFPYKNFNTALKNRMDLTNYRADRLDLGSLNSNKSLLYEIPTYTGIVGYMPKKFHEFILHFGYPKQTTLIYPEDSSTDDRFLDLSAVRYTFVSESQFKERPQPLSRLNLFTSYEVVADESAQLARLKSDAFNPRDTVLLGARTPWGERITRSQTVQFIPIAKNERDHVAAQIENAVPAIVLFAETFDKGWKAYVDGKETNILPANFAFMACALEPGRHTVEFRFKPAGFYYSLYLTVIGIAIGILSAAALFLSRRFSKAA